MRGDCSRSERRLRGRPDNGKIGDGALELTQCAVACSGRVCKNTGIGVEGGVDGAGCMTRTGAGSFESMQLSTTSKLTLLTKLQSPLPRRAASASLYCEC